MQKILKLRLFDQDEKKWHCNVMDMSYEILSISQFTLCYKLKGNKLDFHMAMPGNLAKQNYQYFLETLGKHYNPSKIKGKNKFNELKVLFCCIFIILKLMLWYKKYKN